MAEYESIHGTRVRYLTSDPTLTSSYEGQVWYNSTAGTNKALVQVKAWATTGNVNTKRISAGGSGTPTAGIIAGGRNGDASPQGDHQTEEYTGYTWSNAPDMSNDRFETEMAGPMSSAVIVGGYDIGISPEKIANVEEFDGSSWSNGTAYPSAVFAGGAAGTQTAAVYFGGYFPPPTNLQASTKEYDGSSWTASNNMVEGRGYMASCGSQTSALAICGKVSPSVDVEEYDGTSWTAGGNYPTANVNAAASGLSTAAIVFSGALVPGGTAMNLSASYDGNVFVTDTSLSTAREQASGSSQGTNQSAWCCLGNPTSPGVATEEYTSSINTVTAAVWASGNNINTTRRNMAAGGITSAGIIAGGFGPPYKNETEEYNGSSWTSQNNIPVAKEAGGGGLGVQTAFVVAGGSGPDSITNGYSQSTQEYDGTNWTATGNLNVARLGGGGWSGTEAAGLGFGGYVGASSPYAPPSKTQSTEEYNGSAWSTGNTVPTGPNTYFNASGTQTATVGVRQVENGTTVVYDGTNWTTGSGTLTVLKGIGSMAKNGTSTASVVFGGTAGNPPSRTGATEEYNGTSFVNTANLATARGSIGGSGNTTEAFAAGGYTGTTNVNSTEEYTYQGTPAATASTLTTS